MVSPIPIDPNTKILHQVYERSHDESDKGIEDPGNDTAVDSNFQHGVQNIEAVTLSWSKTSLIIAFVLIWIIYFVQGLVAGISGALIPYVTSDFAMHSLTATTSV